MNALSFGEHVWYVIQTTTGGEDAAVSAICEVAGDSDAIKEVFCPRYKTGEKREGVWVTCEKVLFPGYIIIDTNNIERVEHGLRSVKKFTKLLGNDKAFVPLDSAEIEWIEAFTQKDDRTVQMSEGYVENGKVIITSGPLLNREGLIKKVNHRKKRAYLQIKMFGRLINAEVGLTIKRKGISKSQTTKSHQAA